MRFHHPALLSGAEYNPLKLNQFARLWTPRDVPRSSAGAHTCAAMYWRPPCVPFSRKREKRPPAAGEGLAAVLRTCMLVCHLLGQILVAPLLERLGEGGDNRVGNCWLQYHNEAHLSQYTKRLQIFLIHEKYVLYLSIDKHRNTV